MGSHAVSTPSGGGRWTRRSWWSLIGFGPSLVLAFVIGEGLVAALGYPSGGADRAPWWAMLVAGVPALVVFALPAVAAVHYGRRALREGDPGGRAPMVVALCLAAAVVLLNAVSGVAVLVTG